jgi:hypothetical protein
MSLYQWYTGSNHPLHGLVYMSNLEFDIMLNPVILNKIHASLPTYLLQIDIYGTLYIKMSTNHYHSLYEECIVHKNTYVLEHLKKCPPTIIQFIYYHIVREQQERRRRAAAI